MEWLVNNCHSIITPYVLVVLLMCSDCSSEVISKHFSPLGRGRDKIMHQELINYFEPFFGVLTEYTFFF